MLFLLKLYRIIEYFYGILLWNIISSNIKDGLALHKFSSKCKAQKLDHCPWRLCLSYTDHLGYV